MAGSNGGVVVVIAGQDDTGKIFEQIDANLKRTANRAHETESALASLGEGFKRGLEVVGIGVGLREAFEGIKEVIGGAIELSNEIDHMAQQTGIATETLSVLKYAGYQADIEFDTLGKSFKKLSSNLNDYQNGSTQAVRTFKELGISQADLQRTGGDLYTIFGLISDRMKDMPDGFKKNALATELFGKSGTQMIHFLNQGSEAIEKYRSEAKQLGIVLDKEAIEKMARVEEEMKKAQTATEGAGFALAGILAPAVVNAAQYWTPLISKLQEYLHYIGLVSDSDKVAAAFNKTPIALKRMTDEQLKDFRASAVDSRNQAQRDFNSAKSEKTKQDAQERYYKADKEAAQADILLNVTPRAKASETAESTKLPFSKSLKEIKSQKDAAQKIVHDIDAANAAAAQRINRADEFFNPKSPSDTIKPGTSDDLAHRIQEAQLKLADALRKQKEVEAQNEAAIDKATADTEISRLDALHSEKLISEEEYANRVLAIHKRLIDGQIKLDEQRLNAIAEESTQVANAKPRDEADRLAKQAKMVELDGESSKIYADIAAQKEKINQLDQAAVSAGVDRLLKARQLNDELAAQLEQSRGGSVEARIRQAEDAYRGVDGKGGRRREIETQGGDLATADKLHEADLARIRVSGLEQDYGVHQSIRDAENQRNEYMRRAGGLTSAEVRNRAQQSGFAQADELEKQMQALAELSEYDESAKAKMEELGEKIYELRNPIDEVTSAMRDGFAGAAEEAILSVDQGLSSLQNLARSAERIFAQAAYTKYIEPAVQKLTAVAIPQPQQKSVSASAITAITNAGAGIVPPAIKDFGKQSSRLTITLLNESGVPLKVGGIQSSGMSDKEKFEANVIDSMATGGVLSQVLKGFI